MILRRFIVWLVPPGLSLRRWRNVRLAYSGLAGMLAGLVDLVLDSGAEHFDTDAVIISTIVFVVVFFGINLAFLLSREVSLQMGERMAAEIGRAIASGETPVIDDGGWPVVRQLREGLYQLLEPRERRLARLQAEVEYYRQLAEDMLGLEMVFEPDCRLRWINPAVETMTGYSRAECMAIESPFDLWVYHKDRPMLRALIERVLQGVPQEDIELRINRKDGGLFWCNCRCYLLRDSLGQACGLRLSAQDIQPRKDADLKLLETVAALRRAQALKEHYLGRSNEERMRMASLLEIVNLGILFVDSDRRAVYVNQVFADMWKLGDRQNLVGARDELLIEASSPLRVDDAAYRQHIEDVIAQRSADAVYDINCTDGRVFRERSSAVAGAEGADEPIGRVWIHEDITEALRTQQRLTDLAERDPLTNLLNRRRFHEDLGRELVAAQRSGGHLALLVFDLDGFKDINDKFGHAAGDEVLHSIAGELSQVVQSDECLFRIGGDEFAILTTQTDAETLTQLAMRIIDKAASPNFNFGGKPFGVNISLGIATTQHTGHSAEALVHAADLAMYQARNEGRNRWVMAPHP